MDLDKTNTIWNKNVVVPQEKSSISFIFKKTQSIQYRDHVENDKSVTSILTTKFVGGSNLLNGWILGRMGPQAPQPHPYALAQGRNCNNYVAHFSLRYILKANMCTFSGYSI